MISRRIIANVVFFALGSVALIAGLVIAIFNVTPKYAVYANFASTGGAFTGQEVTYRGVTIGRIGELELTGDGIRMELVIDEEYDRIPADTRARVMFKSAVGEQFVDLLPPSDEGPFLAEGSVIPRERTELPVQQEELLRLLARVLDGVPPEAIGGLVDTLGEGLGGRGDQLATALRAFDPISDVLARRTEELNRLNVNSDRTGTAFSATAGEFAAGIRELATVAESLGRAGPALERLLAEGASDGEILASLISARRADIEQIIADLARITSVNFEHFDSLKASVELLEAFLGTFLGAFDPETVRFRFGQVQGQVANPPCSYGTPHRSPSERTGDAPYHPILEFDCEGAGGSSSTAPSSPARPPGRPATSSSHWSGIFVATLPR